MTKEKSKVSFVHSLKFKILLMMLLSITASTVILLIVVVPKAKSSIEDMVKNNMMSLGKAYSTTIENFSKAKKLTYDDYNEVVGGAGLQGVESSYVYVVSEDGTMLYHPTKEKVGNKVENIVVKGLVEKIKNGEHPADDIATYEFDGEVKYAGYNVLENNSIVVISADRSEVFTPVNVIVRRGIAVGTVILIMALIVAIFLATRIAKPIISLSEIISRASEFDFSQSDVVSYIAKAHDETGVMAGAVLNMSNQMRDMVKRMENVKESIGKNVDELKAITTEVNEKCTDNSATTEQLAAGMEETSATSETITSNVKYMQQDSMEIKELSVSGEKLSEDIKVRAAELHHQTDIAAKRTKEVYETVKLRTENAIEQSKAVDKINELTDSIMEISSQTNLLALNASIEAARAGEAGKGFAVVASEIGHLANQSSDAVSSINMIMEEIKTAVSSMLESLEQSMEFLENVVITDYQKFNEVSVQYSKDADAFNNSMSDIESSAEKFSDTIKDIVQALNGMNTTISETAIGVGDIAEKTTDIVEGTIRNQGIVSDCLNSAHELTELVSKFKL